MKFDDLKEYGSEAGVRAHGKLKTQGKEYVVEEGDIILFKVRQPTFTPLIQYIYKFLP